MQILLIVLTVVLVYAWVLFPCLLAVLSRQVVKREEHAVDAGTPFSVAILLSAHNEESVISARLENLVQAGNQKSEIGNQKSEIGNQKSEVRSRKSAIFLGIDGSTDRTAAIAREFASRHDNVRVIEFNQRRGKVAVLKDLVKACDGKKENQILVFTDANTLFMPGALETLLVNFSDPGIGGVCGRLEFREIADSQLPISECQTKNKGDADQSSPSEAFYWRWENQVKVMESNIDSCLGANGAIYALRSELFWWDIPDNTIVDDFVIGMKVRESGYRMIFEPEAVAAEAFPGERDEWRRRVRIGAGDYQALTTCWKCLLPRYGEFACVFLSHKVLRWFTPHMVLLMVVVSALSVARHGAGIGSWLPVTILIGMAGLLICAGIGGLLNLSIHPAGRFFRLCKYFVVMNAALFAGSIRFLAGNLKGYWDRTPR